MGGMRACRSRCKVASEGADLRGKRCARTSSRSRTLFEVEGGSTCRRSSPWEAQASVDAQAPLRRGRHTRRHGWAQRFSINSLVIHQYSCTTVA